MNPDQKYNHFGFADKLPSALLPIPSNTEYFEPTIEC